MVWEAMLYDEAKDVIDHDYEICGIICATEAGPPPENWKPEETQ
jgi:hypothetical protein